MALEETMQRELKTVPHSTDPLPPSVRRSSTVAVYLRKLAEAVEQGLVDGFEVKWDGGVEVESRLKLATVSALVPTEGR